MAPSSSSSPSGKLDVALDEAKLSAAASSEQGEVFVLQWLNKAEVGLQKLDQTDLLSVQHEVEKALLRLVCPVDLNALSDNPVAATQMAYAAVPKPGRPSRQLIARCFVQLFKRGETRSLYDVLQTLQQIAGDDVKGRAAAEKESKAAALYVAGELFLAAGQNVMSQFVSLLALCQRVFKNGNLPVLVRYHALLCLSKVLKSGAKSLNEQSAKELLKSLRQGLSDRAGAVSRGCADCLLVVLQDASYLSARAEIESLLTICFKVMDTADFITMRHMSRLASALLAHTQKENVVQPVPATTSKKSKKKGENKEDSSDDEAGPSTPNTTGMDGAGRTIMSAKAMLSQLSSAFLRPSTTKRGRGALLDVYATLLEQLGSSWVQAHYDDLIYNMVDEIPNHARGLSSRADVLSVRNGVALILRRVVGERLLDEASQVGAIQSLCSTFLKRWPVLTPGQHPPSKYSLVLAFNETSGLLAQLGSAPVQVLDALQQPLLRCLAHPSHSVQTSAAWCLRTLCYINPSQLSSMLEDVLNELNRDLNNLKSAGERSGAELPKRASGRARGLAALLSVIAHRPLYVSFDISNKVLDLAIKLLKTSAEHNLTVSAVEIQISWTLIGALMSLGPNFVRDHLNQLLNMWRSALPKTADGAPARSDAEWAFLLHVRECTLGSVLAFLLHNGSTLVTLDTARRLIALLSNSLAFVNQFNAQHPTLAQEQVPGTERASLTLLDREQMVRRRVLQCFARIANNPALEALQENLVQASLQTFADPDRYIGSAAQAAIAASAGNFTSIWQLTDGYAYGVTSLLFDMHCSIAEPHSGVSVQSSLRTSKLNRDTIEAQLDAFQRQPILSAIEHDPIVLYTDMQDVHDAGLPCPVPPSTASVDAAIELFASLLPFQKREVQISSMEMLLAYSRSAKLEKNPARRMAIQANACTAILGALRTAVKPTVNGRHASGFNNERFTTALRQVLVDALMQGDPTLRTAASEAYGRLSAISGSQAMSAQVQVLVDQVVSNRDPDTRAGCALAFGTVYREVGGLAAGPLTKTVVDILMSLANDPHPTVHYSALEALCMVVEAASLSYSPYVSSTLGMLVKLYMLSSHEPEGGSAGSVNLRADLPANQEICRVINALIGVQGPDLRDSTKIRTLIMVLLKEQSYDPDDGVVVESTKAMQHLILFASEHVDLVAWMTALQTRLKSSNRPLKVAAINGFYQLIQRNALLVSKVCGNSLVEEFFALLDGDADTDGVRQLLRNWLRQTADLSPCGWIDLCQVVSKSSQSGANAGSTSSTKRQSHIGGLGALQDEEAATIDLGDDGGKEGAGAKQSRWRTQLFALECLHGVFLTVRRAGKLEHFDTPRHATQLSSRVGDLIRMAFTASTALNAEIRLEGLTILRDVIDNFKNTRDPDFDEALLLEQHQAPIAAALTPAFLSDSTPEVLAKAVHVCAVFVGSGVVREVEKLGRILKLLTRALERCLEEKMTSMGDVDNLSSNASATLKVAVFAAWAQLQVASVQQPYLVQIVQPKIDRLATMWVRCLAEYASLRADPEATGMAIAPVVNPILDTPYAGLIRAVLVPHHQRAWTTILHAVAVLMSKRDNKSIVAAMEGEESAAATDGADDDQLQQSAFRSEPVLYFYPLYGLAFEALATGSGSLREVQGVRTTLLALRYLCNARFAGSVLLQDDLFDELINVCYRVVMTEPARVQIRVVEMISSFVESYGARLTAASQASDNGANMDDEVGGLVPRTKLTTCLRLVLFAIQNARSLGTASTAASLTEDRTSLIRSAYTAYCAIVKHFTKTQQEHMFIAGFYAYSELLRDEESELDLVGPTLASLKELCQASMSVYGDALDRTVLGFLSANLNTLDGMRTRSGPVALIKTRNAFLSTVVILTSLPNDVSVSQSVLEQYCYLLGQRLRPSNTDDRAEEQELSVALTAINCVKTLLLAASRKSGSKQDSSLTLHPAVAFCLGQTLTALVSMLSSAQSSELAGEWVLNDAKRRIVEEALKTLNGYLGVVQDDEECRARMLGIILPTLAVFLRNEEEEQDYVEDEEEVTNADAKSTLALRRRKCVAQLRSTAVHQILALARQSVHAFRSVLGALPAHERAQVEHGLRSAVGDANEAQRADQPVRNEAKTIELKSFG